MSTNDENFKAAYLKCLIDINGLQIYLNELRILSMQILVSAVDDDDDDELQMKYVDLFNLQFIERNCSFVI